MNLYHLRYFVTLAHLEHYTRAAEELMITQPSLSHAIAMLEEELGVSLFEKEGRNVGLTKFGKMFLADVEKSLEILDCSVNTLQMAGTGAGRIDIAFLRTLGTNFIPSLVRSYLDTHQKTEIHFHFHTDTGLTPDILQGLKNKKYDIAFCSKIDKESSIEFTPIARQELVVIVPLDHPLASRTSIDLSETLSYPQILFSRKSGLRPIIDQLFEKIGERPTVAYEVDEDQVIAGFVAKNFGIAVVPHMPILSDTDVKVLEIVSPSWERLFYMAVMKNKYLPPAAKDFKDFVTRNVQI